LLLWLALGNYSIQELALEQGSCRKREGAEIAWASCWREPIKTLKYEHAVALTTLKMIW
jgi:hypothetical protein